MTTLGLGRHEAADLLEQRARESAGGGMGQGNGRGFWQSITENKLLSAIAFALMGLAASWFLEVTDTKRAVITHSEQLVDHEKRLRGAENQLLVDSEWKRNTDKKLDQILDEVKDSKRSRR